MIEVVMRRLMLLPVLLALSACGGVFTTEQPLLSAGGGQPEPGLWALAAPNCPVPTKPDVQNWPDCAAPMWVGPQQVTVIWQTPVRSEFILSDGEPRIARVREKTQDENGAWRDGRYVYWAFRTEDAAPHRRAQVWEFACPEAQAGENGAGCAIDDEADLRRLARASVQGPADLTASFVAPGG